MIATKVFGGLGNQLFQYAAARALAQKLEQPLALDISEFANYRLRRFLLEKYRIPLSYLSAKDLLILRMQDSPFRRVVPVPPGFQVIREQQHCYTEIKVQKPEKSVYLSGYWQSEKYFSEAAELIREEVQLQSAPAGRNAELLQQISGKEAVSLHVRRGDYVSNPVAAAYHGICGLDYYANAIEYVHMHLSEPHFFIFSDDIPWARANLDIKHPVTYVDHNIDDPCEDLRLMSACRHFIIANSSFSWWGAWLSVFSKKIVIAPRKWFLTPDKDDRDQVPDAWIRM